MSATTVIINFMGSVALLLWGLRMVRTGVMRAWGSRLRHSLGKSLDRRLKAFAMGLGVTTVLQSSTATALMAASFAQRGLVATTPALAVMLGADVGSSLVAQILSLRLSWLSPLLTFAGVVLFLSSGATRRRDFGRVLIGLGLMLLALQLVIAASNPIRDSNLALSIIAGVASEPVLAILIAAGLTWLAHSSLAVIILIASLAHNGLLPAEGALALALGANMGGGLPALLATWRSEAAARRVTAANLAFKTIMALAVLPWLGLVQPWLSLVGADPGIQVLNFHMAFNLVLALVFLPLAGIAGKVMTRLIPDEPMGDDAGKARYLDETALDTPPLAIAAAARETLRIGDTLESMLRDTLVVFETDDRKLVKEIEDRDDIVDRLQEAIKLYLAKVSRDALGDAENRRALDIINFTTNLEHVGDIIDKNLMELAQKKIRHRLRFSEEGFADIVKMHAQVISSLQLAMAVFMSGDLRMARQLLEEKTEFRDLERAAAERHVERLRNGRAESIESSSLHLDILRDFKRINSHLASVAYPILEAAGALRDSRLRQSQGEQVTGR